MTKYIYREIRTNKHINEQISNAIMNIYITLRAYVIIIRKDGIIIYKTILKKEYAVASQ